MLSVSYEVSMLLVFRAAPKCSRCSLAYTFISSSYRNDESFLLDVEAIATKVVMFELHLDLLAGGVVDHFW